ncbi:MAG: helix-turn-helix domain-containing protein [Myxococcota bacterium]
MKAAKSLARGMQRLRRDLGMSQADLAEASDLSVQFIAALEQGTRSATLQTLDKLAAALRVTPAQLLTVGEPRRDKGSAADAMARLVEGLSPKDQERLVSIVREARNLAKPTSHKVRRS